VQLLQDLALHNSDPAKVNEYISWAQEAGNLIKATIGFSRDYKNFGNVSSGWQLIFPIIESAMTGITLGSVTIHNQIPDDLRVFTDPIIRKVFSTLFDNSIRHGRNVSTIRIFCSEFEHTLIIMSMAVIISSIRAVEIPQCGTMDQQSEVSPMIRYEEYLMIRDLALKQEITTGRVNISVLSKQLNLDQKIIRKYLLDPTTTSELHRQQKPGKLDPFKEYISQRLEQLPLLSSIRLYEEIQNQGYSGGYTIVKDYIRFIRPKPAALPEYRYETEPGRDRFK
jgi:hypothetical protein